MSSHAPWHPHARGATQKIDGNVMREVRGGGVVILEEMQVRLDVAETSFNFTSSLALARIAAYHSSRQISITNTASAAECMLEMV